jgi:integrase
VVRLRGNDVDAERGMLRVEQGQGRKDRYTLLDEIAAAMELEVRVRKDPEAGRRRAVWRSCGRPSGGIAL